MTIAFAVVCAGLAFARDNGYAPELRDRCWMWGHDTGAFDGPGNSYNIPVSDPVTMGEAARWMGVSNVCVVRWTPADADEKYLDQFATTARLGWLVASAYSKPEKNASLTEGALRMLDRLPKLTTLELDDFFRLDLPTGSVEIAGVRTPVAHGAYTIDELRRLRARLAERGADAPELRLVLYAKELEGPIAPYFDFVDSVTLWTWDGDDLSSLERNFRRYRELAPAKPTYLGIYMWDFGGKKPIGMDFMRHQLEVGLRLFRRGEIEGLIFHCTPLVNKRLEAVEYAREWFAAHGGERHGCDRPLFVGLSEICRTNTMNSAQSFYARALQKAGHVPVLIPRTTDPAILDATVARLDALVMTGGEDVDPARYGDARRPKCGKPNLARDEYEWALLAAATRRRLPILGICRGCQSLNAFLGGTLHQDINSECTPPGGGKMAHPGSTAPYSAQEDGAPAHTVAIVKGTRFATVVGEAPLAVNSYHHQAVKRLAPGARVTALSSDGVVEAWESTAYPAAGIQFHPEALYSVGRHPGFDYGRLGAIFVRLRDVLGADGVSASAK